MISVYSVLPAGTKSQVLGVTKRNGEFECIRFSIESDKASPQCYTALWWI